ncbi:MAG: carboxypeptidase-like regulatory domain-containing protein, partial [Fidelibacterota bacterium]
ASRSITWTPGNYLLHPTFKAFKKVVSGTVAGTVKDTSGAAVQNALIEATSPDDTFSTVAGSTGAYQLILVGGTYAITASADGFTAADTVYSDLNIQAESVSTGYDFTLQ